MKAVGTYLAVLRKSYYGSREAAVKALGIERSSLERIETGSHDSRGSAVLTLMKAVDAPWSDIISLMGDSSITEDKAADIADKRIEEQRRYQRIRADAYQRQLLDLSEKLSSNPILFGRLLGFGEALLQELEVKEKPRPDEDVVDDYALDELEQELDRINGNNH